MAERSRLERMQQRLVTALLSNGQTSSELPISMLARGIDPMRRGVKPDPELVADASAEIDRHLSKSAPAPWGCIPPELFMDAQLLPTTEHGIVGKVKGATMLVFGQQGIAGQDVYLECKACGERMRDRAKGPVCTKCKGTDVGGMQSTEGRVRPVLMRPVVPEGRKCFAMAWCSSAPLTASEVRGLGTSKPSVTLAPSSKRGVSMLRFWWCLYVG
jgi:hypothetical protein